MKHVILYLFVAAPFVALLYSIFSTRRWLARESRMNAPSGLITRWAELASGVEDSRDRFAHGHAQATPHMDVPGDFFYLVFQAKPEDTFATAFVGIKCLPENMDAVESSYHSAFQGRQLSFMESPEKDALFASIHKANILAQDSGEKHALRLWYANKLHRLHLV